MNIMHDIDEILLVESLLRRCRLRSFLTVLRHETARGICRLHACGLCPGAYDTEGGHDEQRDNRERVELSRREFLAATGGAVAGAAAFGLAGPEQAGEPKPGRGGTLRVATRSDAVALDPHRNIMYYVSFPIAWTTMGLLDLNTEARASSRVLPRSGDISKDLLTYTFKLRKGVLFHNGREVDAAAVKWNYERIKDPRIGHAFTRSALGNLKEVLAADKYTLICKLEHPSAAFLSNVVYYPCNLMAPDSEAQADTHPIGCGPFKFVKWERHNLTLLERFENYFETDAQGNPLPYLQGH